MGESWNPSASGVMRLPSGRLIRGRSLRTGLPAGPRPEFGIYLLRSSPPATPWDSCWLRWPDFWLPADRDTLAAVLTEAWRRTTTERVEVACAGGRGRTGTALACLAVLDGVPASDAVAFVRQHYHPRAVDTPWQRRFVTRWPDRLDGLSDPPTDMHDSITDISG